MALIRWEPFREIETLQRQMNRLFEDITTRADGEYHGFAFVPSAELEDTPEAILLRLEVPGLEPEDLDVQVTAESVAITGERRTEVRTEEKGLTRSEFRYGKFQRVIPLPVRIQNNQVQAEYKNGILKLTLPKAEEERNRVVKVPIS